MDMTYDELCKQLNLQHYDNNTNKLEILEQWCAEHISQECKFYGSPQERYNAYLDLAQDYLDNFLPFASMDHINPIPQWSNMNAIQYAASRGYEHFLSRLAERTPTSKWSTQTQSGMTALHLAAIGGYYHSAMILLERGAEPNIANQKGKFPLQSALFIPMSADENIEQLKATKMQLFQLLHDKALSVLNTADVNGETVVHQMAAQGFDVLIRNLVQNNNAVVAQPNNFKKYPIHFAILNRQLHCAQELLAFAGVVDLSDAEGRTSLHYAAKYGNEDFIEACCKQGAKIDARDKYAITPLLIAAETGNLSLVQLLISKGADPLLTNYEGLSILHFAVKSKKPELVSWILANIEINVNIQDRTTHTPLDCIQEEPLQDALAEQVKNLLISKGATSSSGNRIYVVSSVD